MFDPRVVLEDRRVVGRAQNFDPKTFGLGLGFDPKGVPVEWTGGFSGVVWKSGRVTDLIQLPPLLHRNSVTQKLWYDCRHQVSPAAANEDGVVVGKVYGYTLSPVEAALPGQNPDEFPDTAAFAYHRSAGIVNLDRAVIKPRFWQLTDAVAVNAKGQVVGHGLFNGSPRAFLLNPLPSVPRAPISPPVRWPLFPQK